MTHDDALRVAQAGPGEPGPDPASAWGGRWRNQMGSTMDLEVSGDEVHGVYASADRGEPGGGPIRSQRLHGFVRGHLIAFTVLWPTGTITAWTGHRLDEAAGARIRTLWHMVTDLADTDDPVRLWTSTLAGADEFTR